MLSSGSNIGAYQIIEPIGKGGMGEVYRARDTKLDRDVAIKVLPEEFAEDDERLARFEREAKLLASLNHPNIASIYGFESNALVLELVEGPTLAERIEQGRLPLDEAIAIAKQIAEALEAGHEAGIIHRDLKPANIKLKEDGTIKVLDYGLAKALEGDSAPTPDSELSHSPTLTRHGTQVGVILGTAAYMSPEQAKGKRVDKRTDIWAFGAVVYEMLTGKRAFAGDDVSETLAAVLRAEPDLDAIPAGTPETLRLVLRLCLRKDVRERLQSIGDVRLALSGAFASASVRGSASSSGVGWRRAMALALLLSGMTGVAVWQAARPSESPRAVVRFSLPLPPGDAITTRASGRALALSPDGTRLVYRANQRLYLRRLDQTVASPIRGSEGAGGSVFFSLDGEWVGFYADGELKKLAIQGGSPVTLCDAGLPIGVRWGTDDNIVFGQREVGIVRVSADGGTPEVLISLPSNNEVGHGPQILPGGESVLFTLGDGYNWNDARIVVESLETGTRRVLVERGRDARYLPTGHLIYVVDGILLAVPFDVDALEVFGGPIPLVEGVQTARVTGDAHFGVSNTGSLVYMPESIFGRTLAWVDRDGREEVLSAEPRGYTFPRISPDGGRVAIDVRGPESDIWIWNLARETLTQLTFAPRQDLLPLWTPDGRRVVFGSDREGTLDLYWKAADGTGTAEQLNESEHSRFPNAITPDGKQLVFSQIKKTGNVTSGSDVAVLSIDGSSEPSPEIELNGWSATLSPDGRWLAYESNAVPREIYVRPFPNVDDGQWPISRGGGTHPLWAPDGSELFYMAPGAKLMAVDVETEPSFVAGKTEMISSGYYYAASGRTYDVSKDGKRFLMIKESVGGDAAEFEVVLNWFSELERLVPTDD